MSERSRRYNPRRLFSFDSLKSSRTASSSDSVNNRHAHERGSTALSQVDEFLREDPFGDGSGPASERQLNDVEEAVNSPSHGRVSTTVSAMQTSEHPSRPSTPDSTTSTTSSSRARWDKIRQHVLLPSSSSSTRQATPQPSNATSVTPSHPRSGTPKPSRLARLGFRQLVEQAKEIAEDALVFSNEVRRACWLSRYGEQLKSKNERDALAATMGSALYLPFMSNPALSGPTMIPAPVTRRQESMGSIGSQTTLSSPSFKPNQRSVPTLKPLWQLLMRYTTPGPTGSPQFTTLPHETLVLSVLQASFLKHSQQGWMQEERRLAMESFELIYKAWFPENESSFVNYCLWCYTAATIPPGHLRRRALNGVYGLLSSQNVKLIRTPAGFDSLVAGLLNLLALSSVNPTYSSDADGMKSIKSCLELLQSGACVAFDPKAFVERYGLAYSKGDEPFVCVLGTFEALSRCIERFKGPARAWLIQYAHDDGWVPLHREWIPNPLLTKLHIEKLNSLSRAMAYVLSPRGAEFGLSDPDIQLLLQLLQARILPEVEMIEAKEAARIKQHIAKVALHMLILNHPNTRKWATSIVFEWFNGTKDWWSAFEFALGDLVNNEVWPTALGVLKAALQLTQDPLRQSIFAFVVPLLNQRIIEDTPPYPCPHLSGILGQLSQRYPPIFYKPIFSCAASSKDYAIINYLCVLTASNKFVPDYWIRDSEMISIALVSDVNKNGALSVGDSTFKHAQLGQLVILVELIGQIQSVRHRKEEIQQTEGAFLEVLRFAVLLESRLAILLDARERETLYPFSHRVLFCILFRELRLLTRSTKPAPWLTKIVTWFVNFHDDEWMSDADYNELEDTLSRLQALYEAARYGVHSSSSRKRTTTLLAMANSAPPSNVEGQKHGIFDTLGQRLHILKSAQKGFTAKAMKLLVLMSTLMTREDYIRLGPTIWMHSLDETASSALDSACFLAMQCAEKTPDDFVAAIEVDLKSSDDLTRIHALQKFSILSARRFELAPQQAITDRQHRLFKLARGPLPFVPTDMGSSSYALEDDFEIGQNSVPLELRKQLAEIGWAQEYSSAALHRAGIRTPMLLLPAQDFGRLEMTSSDNQLFPPSPLLTPEISPSGESTTEQQILRRNSSSGGPSYTVKRRSVFVPSLALALIHIAALVVDPTIAVASVARNLILDLMRNDPSLVSRPLLDLLSNDDKDIPLAMSRLSLLLRAHWETPPSMAHYVFNHLAGYLKAIAKEDGRYDLLEDLAGTILPLADLVPHVSGISLRELRRSKIEPFLVPTGSFWFPRNSPNEHIFPTGPSRSRKPSESVPSRLISVTLIRVSQNLLFASILRKNQQDVQFIRKTMSRFELPSINETQGLPDLELADFLPSEGHERKSTNNNTLSALSMMLSRSYLLLVAQIFRSMSRHLSDRNELEVFIDGLNRILLAHGDDIGIVGQTLVTLMTASTRFRRLFMSGGAYMLFMPAVLKTYADAESNSGIKSAIEYGIGRFYAVHKDAFIFQSLDVISKLAARPGLTGEKLGKSLVDLFASLRGTSASDPAGIHDSNRGHEREALILDTAAEKPQALLASIKRGTLEDAEQLVFDLPEEYPAPKFRVSDFVKLFFTIIAHDIHSLRAEHFLKLFSFVVPHLYRTSMASRPVLQEGIDALGTILMKPSAKTKPSHSVSEKLLGTEKGTEQSSTGTSRSTSNVGTMRLDYLALVVSFVRSGGTVTPVTIRRITDIIRGILRDSGKPDNKISVLLSDLTEILLLRENPSGVKEVVAYLQDLTPFISTYGVTLNFSRIFAALARLTATPTFANDNSFTRALVHICEAGLAACALAGTDKLIMALPHRLSLVSLLSHAAVLRGVDIGSELEKHPPTYDYLAGIILPFVITVGTEATAPRVESDLGPGQHPSIIHLWIRLLQYTLTACQSNRLSTVSDGDRKSMDRSRSMDSTRTSIPAQVPTFSIAVQVLKAIFVRAGVDLSSRLPSLWHRLAVFFKKALDGGNAEFAFQPREPSLPSSPMMSPVVSPRTSLQLDPSTMGPTTSYFHQSPNILQRAYQSPRIVDYVMWSLFELLCSFRTPLLLQMRFFIAEKAMDLDQALRSQNLYGTSSPALSVSGSRPMSVSTFSKPFRRTSGLPSPAISATLYQGQNSPQTSAYLTVSDGRKPGYQYQSPVVSAGGQDPRPRLPIVHLGPIPSSLLRPAVLTNDTGDIPLATKVAKVKSLSLVRETYRRIRLVQTYMGYHNILPVPYHEGTDVDMEEVAPPSWTMHQALEAIKSEVNELLEEFEKTMV